MSEPDPGGWASPASFEQEAIWNDERAGAAESAYSLFAAYDIDGPLVPGDLLAAIDGVIARHEVLRTTFTLGDGSLDQVVWDTGWPPVVLDLRDLPPAAAEHAVTAVLRQERAHRFDLELGPLFRTLVALLPARRAVLVVNAHHILLDEWSLTLLMDDLTRLYAHGPGALPGPAGRYADYAQWQRSRRDDPAVGFWRDLLAGAVPVRLPVRPGRSGTARRSARVSADTALTAGETWVRARAHGATPHTTGLCAVSLALARFDESATTAPLVTFPAANRGHRATEDTAGLFVTMLPVPVDLSGTTTVGEAVSASAAAEAAAVAHQSLPLTEIAAAASRSAAELLSVVYQVRDRTSGHTPGLPGCVVTARPDDTVTTVFDLSLILEFDDHGVRVAAEYDAHRYERGLAEALCRTAAAFLEAAVRDPGAAIAEVGPAGLPMALARAVQSVHRADPYDRFAAWVDRTPDGCAVRWPGGSWTYAELAERARAVAGTLAGDGPAPLGILMDRGPEAVAAIVAAAGVGRPYVPLDPADPPARLAAVAGRAGVRTLLVSTATRGVGLPGTDEIDVAAVIARTSAGPAPDRTPIPRDAPLAVLHTSGSSGVPKGVVVSRANVANLVAQEFVELGPGRTVAHTAPLAFDASTFEVWCALGSGAAIAVIDTDVTTEPAALRAALTDLDVTTMWVTTSLFNHIVRLDPTTFQDLDAVVTGGERAAPEAFRAVLGLAGPAVLNAYGPTEATTFTTMYRAASVDEGEQDVPLGPPLRGVATYVLDRWIGPVPRDGAGELWIGGDGVAHGYAGSPRQTAERFLPDPFAGRPGARMYRSGDLVRHRAGALLFTGRADRQVKVLGHRVELPEVEAATLGIPGVRSATALARPGAAGEAALWLAVESATVSATQVRAGLAAALPGYALPARVVVRERFPLTPSGKTDPMALFDETGTADLTASNDPVVRAVAELWRTALDQAPRSLDDQFFAMGGNSLNAVRLLDLVRDEFGTAVPVRRFYEQPTVGALVGLVRAHEAEGPDELTALFAQVERAAGDHR